MSNKFGIHLRWYLGELANAELDQIESGEIEIYGEDEQGREGSTECDVLELVGAAVELIDEQAARIKALESREKRVIRSIVDRAFNTAPCDAQTFDTFWEQFLKVEDGKLWVREGVTWNISQHKDGVAAIENDEQIKLK